MIKTDVAVLQFGQHRLPRTLAGPGVVRIDAVADIEAAAGEARRVIVVGDDADLAAVLTRLMRVERLDVEVGHIAGRNRSPLAVRRVLQAPARRVPLVRDETGTALVGAARWLPPAGSATIRGEAVVDDTVLFDGEVAEVRIEPTGAMPGLRACVVGRGRRRWVSGRAAQLGTTGVVVVRDGVAGPRELKRSTFYRHTTGWLRVG